jgi:hypothetical protein
MGDEVDHCLKCNAGWRHGKIPPGGTCPVCGQPEWDKEYDLSSFLGAGNDYYVAGERIGENGLLMDLDLRLSSNRSSTFRAPLCHRLKSYYRHAKGDLRVDDGRELMVSFDGVAGHPDRRWSMKVRRQHDWEARRLVTDRCRRHQWAVSVYLGGTNPNFPADREHCGCPTSSACEVCVVAAKFAEDRRRPGSDGARFWPDLQHAAMRDLGLMA